MNTSKLNELLNKRSQLNTKIQILKDEVKTIEDSIKDYLEHEDLDGIKTDIYNVIYSEVTKHLFNEDLFVKENGEDKLNYYKNRLSSSRPFKVYPIKK